MGRAWLAAIAGLGLAVAGSPASAAVYFVLDASGSMWGQIDGRHKIEIAREVLRDLVRELPADLDVGLEAYGHNRKGDCDDIEVLARPGADRATIVAAVDGIQPKGMTPLTQSIRVAATELRQTEGASSIVVVSDGKETCDGDPCAAAAEARSSGVDVRIHVVGFDVTAEEAAQLECIAKNGGGNYYGASNAAEMVTAFAQVKQEVVAPPPPAPTVYFLDSFDGPKLASHWEVQNPVPDSYIVENGELLVLSSKTGDPQKGAFPNLFRLTGKAMPPGDWTASITGSVDLATAREVFEFGLHTDQANYFSWGFRYAKGCCPNDRVLGHASKVAGGERTSADAHLAGGGYAGFDKVKSGFPQPFHLRVEKKGRSYFGSIKLGDKPDAAVIELPKVTSLTGGGNLWFGLRQSEEVGGETTLRVQEVRIEAR